MDSLGIVDLTVPSSTECGADDPDWFLPVAEQKLAQIPCKVVQYAPCPQISLLSCIILIRSKFLISEASVTTSFFFCASCVCVWVSVSVGWLFAPPGPRPRVTASRMTTRRLRMCFLTTGGTELLKMVRRAVMSAGGCSTMVNRTWFCSTYLGIG